MTFRTIATTFALALMAAAGPALPVMADVTPEEVWQSWQDSSAAMGQAIVAASATRQGDALVISDVTIASTADAATVEASLASITMTDQGDGTVLVTTAAQMPMKMRLPAMEQGRPEIETDILVTMEGLTMLARGTADDITYDLTAPSLSMQLSRINGPQGQAADVTVDATLTDMSGTYGTKLADGVMTMASDIAIAGLAIAVTGQDQGMADGQGAGSGGDIRLTAAMTGVTSKTSGLVLGDLAGSGMGPQALAAMDSLSDLATQSTQFDLEIVDESGATRIAGTMGAGTALATVSGGVMDYSGGQSDIALTINSPSIPLPDVTVTLDQADFALNLPLIPSDIAQPFAFSTSLQRLALSDQLWAMFDPSGSLPRDPITFVIDADGTAKPNAAIDVAGTMPADLETLNLKELRLSLAGAQLTGAGTSTFEAVPGGLPNPNAKLDFTLTGANGLMDKLVAAGLLPPEAMTMPRMLLAMVARPAADGSDSYQSVIEIKDKAIIANGQKLHQME